MVTKRGRLWLSRGAGITLAVVVCGLFAAAWYYAGEIERQVFAARGAAGTADLAVLDLSESSLELPADTRTLKPGRWGLDFSDAYLEVGEVVETAGETVARTVLATEGSVAIGERAAWDRMAFSSPESRHIDYQAVLFEGPLGPLSAWVTEGPSNTWVVFVHGAGADRREALRAIPTAMELGFPTLTITYRNDVGAPPSSSGRHGYGRNEWADLHAAVDFARDQGARRLVIVGYGSGASVASVFMHQSAFATMVVGLVFDAPVLDVAQVVKQRAAEVRVPGFIVAWARAIATFRFGVEWGALDHVAAATEVAVPVLLIHGDEDTEAPIEASRAYADANPFLANLITVDGAGHGEAWNIDPEAYEAVLRDFLEAFGPEDAEQP